MKRGKPISKKQFEIHWKQIVYQLEIEGLKPNAEDKEAMRKVMMGEAPLSEISKGLV